MIGETEVNTRLWTQPLPLGGSRSLRKADFELTVVRASLPAHELKLPHLLNVLIPVVRLCGIHQKLLRTFEAPFE